jgi:hypothetical protein
MGNWDWGPCGVGSEAPWGRGASQTTGIERIADHDAAGIGRSMIHHAAGIARSMIHHAPRVG